MKLDTITIGGFLRFTEPVTLDLRDVPPGLVAITGENGAGKSTLLEAPLAALYRNFPSRGELVNYATGKDSFLEATFTAAAGRYGARVNVDGVRRTTDAVLFLDAGTPGIGQPLNDGKATTFDAAVRRVFPSQDLLLASSFAAQNQAGNFIHRKPAQRRELFGELLGLAALTTMGQTAKGLAALLEQARGRLNSVRSLLLAETQPAAFEALSLEDAAAAQKATHAEAARATASTALVELEARLATMRDAVGAYAQATERVTRLKGDLATRQLEYDWLTLERDQRVAAFHGEQFTRKGRHQAYLEDIDRKLAGNAQIRTMADDIRAAVATVARIDQDLATARESLEAATSAHWAVVTRLTEAERQLATLGDVERQQQRAQRDAGLLETVPCGGAGEFAACAFLQDAQAAKAKLAEYVAVLEPKAALADQVGDYTRRRDEHAAIIATVKARVAALTAERHAVESLAGYAAKLEASEARVTELEAQRARAEAEHAGAVVEDAARQSRDDADYRGRLEALQVAIDHLRPALSTAERDLAGLADRNTTAGALQFQLQQARGEHERSVAALATIEATRQEYSRRRGLLERKRELRAELEARLQRVDTELIEWQLLAKALGKDGLPDLEIDAAGPTISAFTNELLEVCHGPRFTLELVTQVAKADGKGMRDEFTVRVTDNASGGTARDIGDLSGGEQVIVSEALRNAIAVYVNQRSPMPIRTCWRDETTGALDPENAQRYLAMLRKVQALGGFDHVLFITHNADAAAQADAQVRLEDGRVRVLLAPFTSEVAA